MEASDAIAWPFAIGGKVAERWDWETDVLDPKYGPPQNRKLRQSPRAFVQFEGLEDTAHRRWLETLLHNNTAGLWHVPLSIDASEITAPVEAGASEIFVPTVDRRFRAGGNALLVGANPRQHQVLEIESVGASSVVLATPTLAGWPAGATIVPTVGGRLVEAPPLSRFTGDSASYPVNFRADEPMDVTGDFGAALYRTFPVFEQSFDWSNDPIYAPERRIDALDSSLGRIRLYDEAGIPLPSIRFDMAAFDRAEIGRYFKLLYALSGRWAPLWVPSMGRDFELTALNSNTTIDVAWTGCSEWDLQANRRDVRITRYGEEPIYRRIVVAAEVDQNTERLELDEALPDGFDAATVSAISYMALCCQSGDSNTLQLWSRDVITSELSFKAINNEF